MSRRQLTQKQHAFLEFLRAHVRDQKVWPTYREIVDHFNYRSPNSVTQNLQALSKKGFLRRDYNGYHLVDRDGKDGAVPLRGTIRDGAFDGDAPAGHISLSSLFQGLPGLHALRLDGTFDRVPALRDAQYVFVADGEAAEGDLAVVLHDGRLALRTVGADGALVDPDGALDPLRAADAEVLGRFAGHAGPYGLVRHALSVQPTAPGAAVSFA